MENKTKESAGTIAKIPPDLVPIVRAMAKSERRTFSGMVIVLIAFAISNYKEVKVTISTS